jgi:hypothetical protein
MGIHGLSKLIGDNASTAVKENDIANYFGPIDMSSLSDPSLLR